MADLGAEVEDTGVALELRPERGYHYVARCSLSAGTTVFHEDPLACSISDTHWRMRCRQCLAIIPPYTERNQSITCSECKRARFCNQGCQEDDAGTHSGSGECVLLSNQAAVEALGVFIREVCLALRLRFRLSAQPLGLPLHGNGQALLGSSWTDPEDKKLLLAGVQCMTDSCKGGRGCGFDEGLHYLGQVLACGVELEPAVPGQGEEVKGAPCGFRERPSGIYKKVSRLNHSCRPNAVYFCLPSRLIEVRTICEVAPGDEISIAYTDLLEPRHVRRIALQQKFCFACTCPRCTIPNDASMDWFLTGVRMGSDGKVWAFRGLVDGDEEVVCSRPSAHLHSSKRHIVETQEDLIHYASEVEDVLQSAVRGYLDGYQGSQNPLKDLVNFETQILAGVKAGMHPLHHTCLMAYSCLSSGLHTQAIARTLQNQGLRVAGPLLWKSALYALVHACAVDAIIVAGERGPVVHAIRSWCNAAGVLCECLAEQCLLVKTDECSDLVCSGELCRLKSGLDGVLVQSHCQNSKNMENIIHNGDVPSLTNGWGLSPVILSMLEELTSSVKEKGDWVDNCSLPVSYITENCVKGSVTMSNSPSWLGSHFQQLFHCSNCCQKSRRALSLCESISWVVARARGYLRICAGSFHVAMDTLAFMPYFHDLPPLVAAKLCQAISMLQDAMCPSM